MIVAGGAVGELALHYLDRFSILVIKVLSKFDFRRLCRVVGATPLARLGAPTPEEAGSVDVVECIEIGGDRVTVFRQDPPIGSAAEKSKTATIVLRGATANTLDDMERAIDDGVNVIKALVKDDRLVPGAGATEIELAKRVEGYGASLKGLSQHAVRRYATALEILPSTLAENAGLDMTEVVSKLYEKHSRPDGVAWGVDIEVRMEVWGFCADWVASLKVMECWTRNKRGFMTRCRRNRGRSSWRPRRPSRSSVSIVSSCPSLLVDPRYRSSLEAGTKIDVHNIELFLICEVTR